MAKKRGVFGMLVLGLVFGMAILGCSNDPLVAQKEETTEITTSGSLGLNGTWYSYGNINRYYFNNGSYEHFYNGIASKKGTYTTTSDSMTMQITHIGSYYFSSYTWLESSTWHSKDSYKKAYLNYQQTLYEKQYGDIDSQVEAYRKKLNTQYDIEAAVEKYKQELKAIYDLNYDSAAQVYRDYLRQKYPTSSEINTMVQNYRNQLNETYKRYVNEEAIDITVSSLYSKSTVSYSLDGNTLILGGTSLTRGK